MKRILCIAVLAAATTSAQAEFMNGNQLLSKLDETDTVNFMLGLGYVMGVHDAYRDIAVCPPPNITAGQAADIVRKHLVANPEKRHYTADFQVMSALGAVWPCAGNKKSRT